MHNNLESMWSLLRSDCFLRSHWAPLGSREFCALVQPEAMSPITSQGRLLRVTHRRFLVEMSDCLIFKRTVLPCSCMLERKVPRCAEAAICACIDHLFLRERGRHCVDAGSVWVIEKTVRMHDNHKMVKHFLHWWSHRCHVVLIHYPDSCCCAELNQEQNFAAFLRRKRNLAERGRDVKDRVLSSTAGRKLSSVDRTSFLAQKLTLDSVGGGYWSPDARALAALRTTIDENPQRLKDVLIDDKMRAEFLSGSSKKAAVQSFVKTNAETALKTKPKVSSQPLLVPLHT